ncbi:hypothetical protein P154DRAFT_572431 [Amniculicola lignicola CBS 123094]|uniref:Uncharacterized protein n=1 Tax=Amniculicola lignicola CBS 123094 TaxID=1392246 RepID=A0A6A5WSE7_9PLEO|nr:hypothetical protein P154DRAFT_572431 [Amniculicola lignicola CBS 123094]
MFPHQRARLSATNPASEDDKRATPSTDRWLPQVRALDSAIYGIEFELDPKRRRTASPNGVTPVLFLISQFGPCQEKVFFGHKEIVLKDDNSEAITVMLKPCYATGNGYPFTPPWSKGDMKAPTRFPCFISGSMKPQINTSTKSFATGLWNASTLHSRAFSEP